MSLLVVVVIVIAPWLWAPLVAAAAAAGHVKLLFCRSIMQQALEQKQNTGCTNVTNNSRLLFLSC